MSCPIPPNLSVTLRPDEDSSGCEGQPKKTAISCSDVMVKFGEVEITQTIELGYNQMAKTLKRLRAKRIGAAKYKYKFSKPNYLAGALVQVHDFHAGSADKIVNVPRPETKTIKVVKDKEGNTVDLKLFKKTPWEYFGCTSASALKRGWDFGDEPTNANMTPDNWSDKDGRIKDLSYDKKDLPGDGKKGLRQAYLREAYVLVGNGGDSSNGLLTDRSRQVEFENYFNSKALQYIDYTNELRILYSLAATGQLPYDVITRKYRIGNNAANPGYTREVKIVLNLYFKVVRAEMASTAGSVFSDVTLNGIEFAQSGASHPTKSCLKVVTVLNNQDSGSVKKGVYFFGVVWGKADPHQTFSKLLEDQPLEPAHGIGTKKSPGKTTATPFNDAYNIKRSYLQDGDAIKMPDNYVRFKDNLNPWGQYIVHRIELLRFFNIERAGAACWELREKAGATNGINQYRTLDKDFWGSPSSAGQSFPVRIARVQAKKAGDHIEIVPGLVLFCNSGANVHSGTIAGSAFQMHMIFPLEVFAVLTDEAQFGKTTLESLPGKFMNMTSQGVLVAHWNIVQTVNDGARIVNAYIKMEKMKEAARKMKEYVEGMRRKFQEHVDALTKAFEARDLAKYTEILNSLKILAADFAQRTGHAVNLQGFVDGQTNLQTFINAQNALINAMPPPPQNPAPTPPNPSATDPQPEGPNIVDVGTEAGGAGGGTTPESTLVIPVIDDPIGVNPLGPTTELPIMPEVLVPSIDTPQLGSTHNLGNIGNSTQSGPGFDEIANGVFQNIPGHDLGVTYDTNPPTWDLGDN